MNAMRFALDDEQFAMGKELRHGEGRRLRNGGILPSSQDQGARCDPGQLPLDVVPEHFSRGGDGATKARSAEIKRPIHPEPDGFAKPVLEQPQSLRGECVGLRIERRSDQSERRDSGRRFDREMGCDLAPE